MKRIAKYALIALGVIMLTAGCRRAELPPEFVASDNTESGSNVEQIGNAQSEPGTSTNPKQTPTPRPLVTASPTPTKAAPDNTAVEYTVRAGDNLLQIAIAHGTTVEALMNINGLTDADQLSIGQVLRVSFDAQYTSPDEMLIPDSELVNSPAYSSFDIAAYIASKGGYLSNFTETVGYETLTGAEIIELVATQYSVGPRVLLAMLELRSGWVTNPAPSEGNALYPLNFLELSYYSGLYHQLSVAADTLNTGFYGWMSDDFWMVHTQDGAFIQLSEKINAGTAGVYRALAGSSANYETWLADIQQFDATYQRLFGDPYTFAVEPLIKPEADPLDLVLPWSADETWYLTGGPHAGYGTVGTGSAVDFVTPERNIGCMVSNYWVTAASDGLVAYSYDGLVYVDADGDGDIRTGWVVIYMHIAGNGRVEAGTTVKAGDRIGHPSCEGGVSNASHLHFTRRYNGVWIGAEDARWPLVLSGWRAVAGSQAYEGEFVRNNETRTACECWDDAINGMTR